MPKDSTETVTFPEGDSRMRHVDFACRTMDNSIFAVFTQTDLREAHVIARRIASVLKHTMLEPEQQRGSIETAIQATARAPVSEGPRNYVPRRTVA